MLTLRPQPPLRSDEKILFDDSQPMETVNRQLIRAKLNYAEVSTRRGNAPRELVLTEGSHRTCFSPTRTRGRTSAP